MGITQPGKKVNSYRPTSFNWVENEDNSLWPILKVATGQFFWIGKLDKYVNGILLKMWCNPIIDQVYESIKEAENYRNS